MIDWLATILSHFPFTLHSVPQHYPLTFSQPSTPTLAKLASRPMFWSDVGCHPAKSWDNPKHSIWPDMSRVQRQAFQNMTQLAGIKLNWLIIWQILSFETWPSLSFASFVESFYLFPFIENNGKYEKFIIFSCYWIYLSSWNKKLKFKFVLLFFLPLWMMTAQ